MRGRGFSKRSLSGEMDVNMGSCVGEIPAPGEGAVKIKTLKIRNV